MLIDTKVVKENSNVKFYDMFSISQIFFEIVKGKEIGCSMRESEILSNCDSCPVQGICKRTEGFVDEMRSSITKIEKEFKFD